jgi:hypothetical protein
MALFFENIDQINQFTLSLELNQGLVVCASCNQSDQFASHGFVYKNLNQGKTMATGKRLFCAVRSGKVVNSSGWDLHSGKVGQPPDSKYWARRE